MIARIGAGLLFIVVFGLAMSHIWGWGTTSFPGGMASIGLCILALAAIYFHERVFVELGFFPGNGNWSDWAWFSEAKNIFLAAGIASLALLLLGLAANRRLFDSPHFFWFTARHPFEYIPWSLTQQMLLCSLAVFVYVSSKNKALTIIVMGLAFGIVHWPNPVLVVMGSCGGAASTYFFLKGPRNIWLLAIAQSIVGAAVHHFIPAAWHHNLLIGPKFFVWHP